MRRLRLLAVSALALAASSPARGAADAPIRVERVEGGPVAAQRLTSIAGNNVVFAADSGEVTVPLADVVEIGFATSPDPPQPRSAKEIAVDLAGGETLFGEIKSGSAQGIVLASPLLGDVPVSVDRMVAVRFLKRLSQMPEPPDLRAAESTDVVHLDNGDRMTCTVESFAANSVVVLTSTGAKTPVAYDRVTALRINGDAAKRPAGALLVVVLRDGSQTIGSAPSSKDGRLKMKSVSGFDVDVALVDVVAAHVLSDRFVYLSDLPATTDVQPFWKPVAGDPNVLYAPRMDRSFTGRALKCGGRNWVKGLGVYAGTTMTFALDGKFSEFRASAGLDDGAGPLGGVVFEVLVDGQTKWTSGFVRPAGTEGRGKPSPVAAPRIDVKGAKSLALRVLSGDAEDPWPVADEADWLGAMLVR
jgi:hypothetical protein